MGDAKLSTAIPSERRGAVARQPRPYPYANNIQADPNFRPPAVDDGGRTNGVVYLLMLVVLAAFAGVVWNFYGGHAPPRIPAPAGAYRVAPAPDVATAPEPADNAMYDNLDGSEQTTATTPRPAPEAPLANANAPAAPATTAPAGPPQVAPTPSFVSNGPYVAQVAALQSEDAVQPAWARLASRAPQLFGAAHLDVERAELGQRGTYFRVRAGYFADRANASRFCDRIKQMGQDCIVVTR